MEQFKRAKIIMLPTKNNTENVLKGYNDNSLLFKYAKEYKSIPAECDYVSFYHLYIISDDEIKEGDWVLTNLHKKIEQVLNNKTSLFYYQQRAKKIIATTDISLKIDNPHYDIGLLAYISLPQPSQQFITKYIEEYNKNQVIIDILIKYELYCNTGSYPNIKKDCNCPCTNTINCGTTLKINQDNTINIQLPKDNWSREEVINLIKKYSVEEPDDWSFLDLDIDDYQNKWIEDNL